MRARQSSSVKSSGFIRIISGKWRGRKLPVINGEGLRPTTDRTKETLFNWLMQDVADANCLDLFAGSGALGLEALSRHAQHVTLVEKHKPIATSLDKLKKLLNASDSELTIVNQEALAWLSNCQQQFNLVFLDPPFNKNLLQPAIEVLLTRELLHDGAIVYLEHEIDLDWQVPEQFTELKRKNTRQVTALLLQFHAS